MAISIILATQIEAGNASFSDTSHPNRMKFKGILVPLDQPSTKPPNGAEGHRIYVSSDVAKSRLDTLVGMGLNYAPDLKSHAQRRKVGVITNAFIEGKDLWVEADIWKHDFPEATRDLKRPDLGMSMELGEVQVEDTSSEVWALKDFCFLGATVLFKDSAAYHSTRAIAAAAAKLQKESAMPFTKKKTTTTIDIEKVVNIAAAAATKAATKAVLDKVMPTVNKQTDILASLSAKLLASEAIEEDIDAGEEAEASEEEDVEACEDMKSAKADDEDDTEDDGDDDEDEEDMESAGESPIAKAPKAKSVKSESVEEAVSKKVTSARLQAALAANKKLKASNKKLSAQVTQLAESQKKLAAEQEKQKVQIAAASEQMSRRSLQTVDPTVAGLLAKNGLNANDMLASKQVLSVSEVDALLVDAHLPPEQRMAIKNKMLAAGFMDPGVVDRSRMIS